MAGISSERKIPAARVVFGTESQSWIQERIAEILSTGALTLGKYTTELEKEFAEYIGVKHAVAVNSGTSALEIPLRIFGVSGKEVIVPTNTFFATAAAVIHAGGAPRLVDIREDDLVPDLEVLERATSSQTAGIIVVHIGGLISPRLPEIRDHCQRKGLFLLEDAAHAHGCSLDGKFAGDFGHAAAFSFYPTKVMTSGEGGIIVTNDEKIQQEALIYRDQGKAGFLENKHVRMGYNWRLSEIHAVLGIAQLRNLKTFIDRRTAIAALYDERLQHQKAVRPLRIPAGAICNYYKYIVTLDPSIDRSALKKRLREGYQVSLSGEVYELPLHLQPIFKDYGQGAFPVAERFCRTHACLPLYSDMTRQEAEYVLWSLERVLSS